MNLPVAEWENACHESADNIDPGRIAGDGRKSTGPSGIIGPALFVTDVARSVKFYAVLGMEVGMEKGRPQQHETILVFRGDASGTAVIMMSDTTTAPIAHGHGYDRLVLRIDDLAAVAAQLLAAGFTPDVIQGGGEVRSSAMTDPDGYRLELVELHRPVRG